MINPSTIVKKVFLFNLEIFNWYHLHHLFFLSIHVTFCVSPYKEHSYYYRILSTMAAISRLNKRQNSWFFCRLIIILIMAMEQNVRGEVEGEVEVEVEVLWSWWCGRAQRRGGKWKNIIPRFIDNLQTSYEDSFTVLLTSQN